MQLAAENLAAAFLGFGGLGGQSGESAQGASEEGEFYGALLSWLGGAAAEGEGAENAPSEGLFSLVPASGEEAEEDVQLDPGLLPFLIARLLSQGEVRRAAGEQEANRALAQRFSDESVKASLGEKARSVAVVSGNDDSDLPLAAVPRESSTHPLTGAAQSLAAQKVAVAGNAPDVAGPGDAQPDGPSLGGGTNRRTPVPPADGALVAELASGDAAARAVAGDDPGTALALHPEPLGGEGTGKANQARGANPQTVVRPPAAPGQDFAVGSEGTPPEPPAGLAPAAAGSDETLAPARQISHGQAASDESTVEPVRATQASGARSRELTASGETDTSARPEPPANPNPPRPRPTASGLAVPEAPQPAAFSSDTVEQAEPEASRPIGQVTQSTPLAASRRASESSKSLPADAKPEPGTAATAESSVPAGAAGKTGAAVDVSQHGRDTSSVPRAATGGPAAGAAQDLHPNGPEVARTNGPAIVERPVSDRPSVDVLLKPAEPSALQETAATPPRHAKAPPPITVELPGGDSPQPTRSTAVPQDIHRPEQALTPKSGKTRPAGENGTKVAQDSDPVKSAESLASQAQPEETDQDDAPEQRAKPLPKVAGARGERSAAPPAEPAAQPAEVTTTLRPTAAARSATPPAPVVQPEGSASRASAPEPVQASESAHRALAIDTLIQQAQLQRRLNGHQLEVVLRDPQLGAMHLRASERGGLVGAELFAAQPRTSHALGESVSQLLESLQQRGLEPMPTQFGAPSDDGSERERRDGRDSQGRRRDQSRAGTRRQTAARFRLALSRA